MIECQVVDIINKCPIIESEWDYTPSEIRGKLIEIETAMKQSGREIKLPLNHYFAPNIYARQIFIPANTLLMGKLHKFEHLNIISLGAVTVLSEFGVQKIKAPHTFISPSGTKRLIYAHEDTIWTTIHTTQLTDVDAIEEEVIAKDYSEVPRIANENKEGEQLCLGQW